MSENLFEAQYDVTKKSKIRKIIIDQTKAAVVEDIPPNSRAFENEESIIVSYLNACFISIEL